MASGQNPPPSTPVKVPASSASYTPATLDPDLRSQINTVLIRDGHVAKYVRLPFPSCSHTHALLFLFTHPPFFVPANQGCT